MLQQGKAHLTKTAQHRQTSGTGPSPLSAKPAQDSRPVAVTQKPSPGNGANTVPRIAIEPQQESAQKQHTNTLGKTAVGKRIEVYWDGEKAW